MKMEKKKSLKIILLEKSRVAIIRTDSKVKQITMNEDNYQIGDIHIGKIKTTLHNINAAFIQIDSVGKNGFIQLENSTSNHIKEKGLINERGIDDSRVLVQIIKEPSGNKGLSLSKDIELKGKYVSLVLLSNKSNPLEKIMEDPKKHYFKLLKIFLSSNHVKLEIKEKTLRINIKHVIKDCKKLYEQWKLIKKKIQESNSPRLISKKVDFSYKILLDFYNGDIHKIILDSKMQAIKISNILMQWQKRKKVLNIEYCLNKKNISKKYNLGNIFQQIIQSRVNLKSGASIVIEKTEALTVIDVNSGTFKNKTKLEKSTFWINCEAAKEISNQLVLRNIGGVVIVDFIDMHSQKDQFHLLYYFNTFLNKDKNNPKIIQFSEIGLVELTRARKGKNVYDVFTMKCYKCDSNGYLLKKLNFTNRKKYNLLALNTMSLQ
jgi:ribonuclease E